MHISGSSSPQPLSLVFFCTYSLLIAQAPLDSTDRGSLALPPMAPLDSANREWLALLPLAPLDGTDRGWLALPPATIFSARVERGALSAH